jgi:hypothetical protein
MMRRSRSSQAWVLRQVMYRRIMLAPAGKRPAKGAQPGNLTCYGTSLDRG